MTAAHTWPEEPKPRHLHTFGPWRAGEGTYAYFRGCTCGRQEYTNNPDE